MAGNSTGISLLTVISAPINRSMLTYSTSTLTTRSLAAVASPDPDYFGNTNYLNSLPTVGVGISSNNSLIHVGTVSTNRYPNYTLQASIDPIYMGSQTGIITPTIRDSGGVVGNTSGPVNVSLNRSYNGSFAFSSVLNWDGPAGGGNTLCFFFDSLDYCHYVRANNTTIGTFVSANREWNTLMALTQNAGLYNEVSFTLNSGQADVVSVSGTTTLILNKSFNTWYDIRSVGVRVTPRATFGINDVWVSCTLRNKMNNAITMTRDILLRVQYT